MKQLKNFQNENLSKIQKESKSKISNYRNSMIIKTKIANESNKENEKEIKTGPVISSSTSLNHKSNHYSLNTVSRNLRLAFDNRGKDKNLFSYH